MVLQQVMLGVGFTNYEGALRYVHVAYTNVCSEDVCATLRAARTAGKSASEREEHKRRRYPPEANPHAELTPFVV